MKRERIIDKCLFIVVILLFSSIGMYGQSKEDLVGKWQNEKYSITYEFQKDGSVVFTQNGSTVFIPEYTLNINQEPAWVDFEMSALTIPGLLKVIDDRTIVIEQFAPTINHPTSFSDSTGSVVSKHTLTKVE